MDGLGGCGGGGERAICERSLTVLAHAAVTGEYRHLVLQAERPMTLARPGQFFHLLCTGEMGMLAPFSVGP